MTDPTDQSPSDAGPIAEQADHPEVVTGVPVPRPVPKGAGSADDGGGRESVEHPAKVMRIGSMIKQLLEEVRAAPLDEAGRDRLQRVFERSVAELGEALSPDLQTELLEFAPPFSDGTPSEAELRVAQAQLVGWLEGLFHGIQATLFAQQMAARQQLDEIRRGLPPGHRPGGPAPGESERPGTYL
jgi:Protein of unknown function (DUF2587)